LILNSKLTFATALRLRVLLLRRIVECLVNADQDAEEELEALALEGLNSGEPIEVGPGYWEEKHRLLDEQLKRSGNP
jgi:hypothetical protein